MAMNDSGEAPRSTAPARTGAGQEALSTAVGLVWGWLDEGQPAQALALVGGCLACWPDQAVLHLLHRHCLVALDLPLPSGNPPVLRGMPPAWMDLLDKLNARQRMRLDAGDPARRQAR